MPDLNLQPPLKHTVTLKDMALFMSQALTGEQVGRIWYCCVLLKELGEGCSAENSFLKNTISAISVHNVSKTTTTKKNLNNLS